MRSGAVRLGLWQMEQARNATQQVRLKREHARPGPIEEAARERLKRFGLARLAARPLDDCITKKNAASTGETILVLGGCRCPLPRRFMMPNGIGGS